MKQIAHRGSTSKYIKENTLEAFTKATQEGFLGIECDVRLSKDNIPVISHDAFIDRCTTHHGLIKEKTYASLLDYNFGTKKVPSKIPTLSEVLKNYKCMKLIELKVEINLDAYLNLIDGETYFISFNPFIIKKLKEKHPNLKAGLLLGSIGDVKNYNYDVICLLDDFVNKKSLIELKNRGIKVFIYGIIGEVKTKDDDIFYITDKKLK